MRYVVKSSSLDLQPLRDHEELVRFTGDEGCGVYFLFNGESLIYVGQTNRSIGERVAEHARSGRRFTQVWCRSVKESKLDHHERHYIRMLKPSDNIIRFG